MSINYTVINSEGLVVTVGSCQEVDVPASDRHLTVLRAVMPPTDSTRRWVWNGKTFVDAGPRRPPDLAGGLRRRRDALLSACDWTQLPDVAPGVQAAWGPYRQALRDLTAQPGFPTAITWPTAP